MSRLIFLSSLNAFYSLLFWRHHTPAHCLQAWDTRVSLDSVQTKDEEGNTAYTASLFHTSHDKK